MKRNNPISEVGTAEIFSEFQSHSILDKKYDYLELQAKNDWNELMYIYVVEKMIFKNLILKDWKIIRLNLPFQILMIIQII